MPKAATGETVEDNVNLGFVIDAESQLYLDGQSIDLANLPQKITELKAEGKKIQALIGADKSAKHGSLVALIDALRKEGIYDFALSIDSN